jgi:hypothetical protein
MKNKEHRSDEKVHDLGFKAILIFFLCVFMLLASSKSKAQMQYGYVQTFYKEYHYKDTSFIHVTTKSEELVVELCNAKLIDEDWDNVWEVSYGMSRNSFDWLQFRYPMDKREELLDIIFLDDYTIETYIFNRTKRNFKKKRRIKS